MGSSRIQAENLVPERTLLIFRAHTHRGHHLEVDRRRVQVPPLEKALHRARHDGEDDIVDTAPEGAPDLFDLLQLHREPVETTVRAHGLIERRLRSERERRPQHVGCGPQSRERLPASLFRLGDEGADSVHELERKERTTQHLIAPQFKRGRRATSEEARPVQLVHFRCGREQDLQEIDARHAIDHAMVHLRDQGEPVTVETFDDPRLPERTRRIERLFHDARRKALPAARRCRAAGGSCAGRGSRC